MIASTDTFEDKPFIRNPQQNKTRRRKVNKKSKKPDQENPKKYFNICRLCQNADSTESRQHLLSECPKTIHLLTAYATDIKQISPLKYSEYCSLEINQRWLWILGGGFINYTTKQNQNKYRLNKTKSPFEKRESVSPGINKDNPHECSKAFFEYKEIESRIPMDALTVFTDGSFKNNKAGSGVVIYQQNNIIGEITAPLGNKSIDFAELNAIFAFLHQLSLDTSIDGNLQIPDHSRHNEQIPVHIFTDSAYAHNKLCSAKITGKHFYIIEEIKNYAKNLQNLNLQYTGFHRISKTLSMEKYQLKAI